MQEIPSLPNHPEIINHAVEVLRPNGEVVNGELRVWEWIPESPDLFLISLRFLGREIKSSDQTEWDALYSVREVLDQEGFLLRCYGASLNVYPSGMSYSMGGGSMAYRLFLGQPGRQKDLVSIYDTGPDMIPSTVKAQEEFHERWVRSL